MAVFREPVPQGFHLPAQAAHLLPTLLDHGVLLREQRFLLLDEFVSLRQLFSQYLILFSQIDQFFFDRRALTLLGVHRLVSPQRTWAVTITTNNAATACERCQQHHHYPK